MNDLIKKAQALSKNKKFTPNIESLELVLAILEGSVTYRAAAEVLGFPNPGHVINSLPTILKWGLKNGKLEIRLTPEA